MRIFVNLRVKKKKEKKSNPLKRNAFRMAFAKIEANEETFNFRPVSVILGKIFYSKVYDEFFPNCF